MQVEMGLGMLGRRHVTPRWVNDPVWIHDVRKGREGWGMIRYPPPGGNRVSGGEEGVG